MTRRLIAGSQARTVGRFPGAPPVASAARRKGVALSHRGHGPGDTVVPNTWGRPDGLDILHLAVRRRHRLAVAAQVLDVQRDGLVHQLAHLVGSVADGDAAGQAGAYASVPGFTSFPKLCVATVPVPG